MCLFRIKDDDFIGKEEDKDLARVALNRAKANAAAKRHVAINYVLLAAILIVSGIMAMPLIQNLGILPISIFWAIFVLLVVPVVWWVLSCRYRETIRKEYENQLFELKVLTRK